VIHKLIIFDLDGTLSESKQPLTREMAVLLSRLLAVTKVSVISGGGLPQFIKQVVAQIPNDANLGNLYLLPTSGGALYEFRNGEWNRIYEERFSDEEVRIIETTLRAVAEETGIINFSERSWGERIENRGGQVTLSALGQQAPVALKKAWDPDHEKRLVLQTAIAQRLPDFTVAYGGATSIDVTKRNIDKAYGARKLCERLGIPESEAFFVGDELGSGGNDEAIFKTNVPTKSVKNPAETERLIESLLAEQTKPTPA